ncbi:MAG: hypothetical protein H3C27_07765 [Opitutaceae bacterium]|nr:hypothetical protein [Opitutaceae bacterium]
MKPSDASPAGAGKALLSEVKYSLPEMLEEIKLERTADSFAMEKLDHLEINKLFKAKRRAKSQT